MKRLLIACAWLAFAGCASPLPQTPPAGVASQVAAPDIRAGAHWTYRVRDGFTDLPRPSETYRVTEVAGDRVSMTVSRENVNDESQLYDRQWNWLTHPATDLQTFNYSPAYPAFAFPLAAGRTWSARLMATDPATGKRFPLTVDGTVLGWERVKVPAGEFDTLKVRRVVFLQYYEPNVRGRSEIVETEWYAPAVNQAVRRETTARYLSYLYGDSGYGLLRVRGMSDGGGGPRIVPDDWFVYELVEYSAR
jgi:hypothetical protein